MDPNSKHQNWSHWVFEVIEAGRHVPGDEVERNAARWMRMGFGDVGQARVKMTPFGWQIECRVEGENAADPSYVRSVELSFRDFVAKGWGMAASGRLVVSRVLAGDVEVGPPSQLVVVPTIGRDA